RLLDHLAQNASVVVIETKLGQRDQLAVARKNTYRNGFPIGRRHSRNTKVVFLLGHLYLDLAVLRQSTLGNVQVRHDLDARNDGTLEPLDAGRNRRLVKQTVNAVPDAKFLFQRLNMDVRRAVTHRLRNDLVDEPDNRGILRHFIDVLNAAVYINPSPL